MREQGGEKQLRAALEVSRAHKGAVDLVLFRSKLEAHYWCLVAKGLREFVGDASQDPVPAAGPGKFAATAAPLDAEHRRSLAHLRADAARSRPSASSTPDLRGATPSDQGLSRAEGAAPTATTRALEERVHEAENQVCLQALYIESLQISLGFSKLLADERDPKQELTLLLGEAEQRRVQSEEAEKAAERKRQKQKEFQEFGVKQARDLAAQ